jgi:pyruvate dehydrogenase E1 component
VSANHIAAATLSRLARDGKFNSADAGKALGQLGIDPERADPARS